MRNENEILQTAFECAVIGRRRRLWHKIVFILAALVIFCTVYALIIPAITLEKDKASEDLQIPTGQTETTSAYEAAESVTESITQSLSGDAE